MGQVEKNLRLGVTIIAAIFYVIIIYVCTTMEGDHTGTMRFFSGLVICLGVLIVQKIVGSIVGSIGNAFDGTVGEVGKKNET